MNEKLLEYLLGQEVFFVEEIDRLYFDQQSIKPVLDDELNGWLYLPGEPGSADWNLARMLGSAERANPLLEKIPRGELQLLVAETAVSCFPEWVKTGLISWYVSDGDSLSEVFEKKLDELDLTWQFRVRPAVSKAISTVGKEIFLLDSRSRIAGLVKTIRETPNFVEVYIEVAPEYRERGLGRTLLAKMIAESRLKGKSITYAVDQNNHASLALAKSVNLRPFNQLFRLIERP